MEFDCIKFYKILDIHDTELESNCFVNTENPYILSNVFGSVCFVFVCFCLDIIILMQRLLPYGPSIMPFCKQRQNLTDLTCFQDYRQNKTLGLL